MGPESTEIHFFPTSSALKWPFVIGKAKEIKSTSLCKLGEGGLKQLMRVPSVSLYFSAHFIVLVDLTWGPVVSGRTFPSI